MSFDGSVAILFDNFGPYHWARLNAAAEQIQIFAIELCAQPDVYQWKRTQSAAHPVTTLFPADARVAGEVPKRHVVRRVRETLDQLDPAAVAIPGWSTPFALAALQWCVDHGRRAIVMSESTAADATRTSLREAIKRRIVALFDSALVGGQLHRQYLEQLGMSRTRIFQGYDAVDNDYFRDNAERFRQSEPELRNQYRLPGKYFLASARFVAKKNISRLLTAFARYRKMQGAGAWSFVLLGDGPLRLEIERVIADLDLAEYVSLPGFKQYDELPIYYALASAFIHASTTEQWGLVINEAMASGMPVLVSNRCGCVPDLVQNDVNGWTFDPFDISAIAESMRRLHAGGDEMRRGMGDKSREIIAAFAPAAFANGLADAVASARQSGPVKRTRLNAAVLQCINHFGR